MHWRQWFLSCEKLRLMQLTNAIDIIRLLSRHFSLIFISVLGVASYGFVCSLRKCVSWFMVYVNTCAVDSVFHGLWSTSMPAQLTPMYLDLECDVNFWASLRKIRTICLVDGNIHSSLATGGGRARTSSWKWPVLQGRTMRYYLFQASQLSWIVRSRSGWSW